MQKPFFNYLLIANLLVSTIGFSRDIDWTESKRQQIRPPLQYSSCVTLLSPEEIPAGSKEYAVNQSVGVILADNTVQDFERQLDKLVAERGPGAVQGGRIYVTGVTMAKKRVTRKQFERVLKTRGFHDVKVTIVSIPGTAFKGFSIQTARALAERIKYWFPSFEMDYQTPLPGEVKSGLLSDAMVEIPNVTYLYTVLSGMDFGLTASIHTSIIIAYNIWTKSLLNWLLRPGFTQTPHDKSGMKALAVAATAKAGEFLKSAATSFPFILNFAVFGKYSKIHNYFLEHGWEATQAQFPTELASFASTQGLTTILQVMFYRMVVVNGIGSWQNRQEGVENADLVRTVVNIDRAPVLVLDAIALFLASTNAYTLWNFGSFDLNGGHVALAALTAAGATAFHWKPNLLDPTLRWYKGLIDVAKRFKAYFSGPDSDDEGGGRARYY